MKIIAIVYAVIVIGLLWYHIPSQAEREQSRAFVAYLEERVRGSDCQESVNGIIVSNNNDGASSTLISLKGKWYKCSYHPKK